MIKLVLIFSVIVFSFTFANAGGSGKMTYSCHVKNYDKEFIDLNCANVDKAVLMRTPASWLPKKFKPKRDAKVNLSLTTVQIEEWSKYTNAMSPNSKEKKF